LRALEHNASDNLIFEVALPRISSARRPAIMLGGYMGGAISRISPGNRTLETPEKVIIVNSHNSLLGAGAQPLWNNAIDDVTNPMKNILESYMKVWKELHTTRCSTPHKRQIPKIHKRGKLRGRR
jgi:hypothetical protein